MRADLINQNNCMHRLLTLIFVVGSSTLNAQTPAAFTLSGKIVGKTDGDLILSYAGMDGKRVSDTCAIKDGKFLFKGSIAEPTMTYLRLREEKYNQKHATNLFIDPGTVSIELNADNFETAKIKGSKTQLEHEGLQKEYKRIQAKYKIQIDSLSSEKDDEKRAAIRERLGPMFNELYRADMNFFNKNPQSYVTAFSLRFHTTDVTLDSLDYYYDRLGKKIQQSSYGKLIKDEIQKIRGGSPGSMAKNFTATDLNGKQVSLSDFKGKYVLLDFWASWCIPCRKGNPHLKELYAKYKDKGIEFIGVSDDDSKPDAWRKAVEKDGLPWLHVLRGFDMDKLTKNVPNDSDISEKFGIHVLPTKILIDKEGKIIGRFNEEEKELDEMLAEIFK